MSHWRQRPSTPYNFLYLIYYALPLSAHLFVRFCLHFITQRIPPGNSWDDREIEMEPTRGKSQSRMRRRVVLFPLPLQGHITPMLQLASILHNKGLSITIIHTTFNSPNSGNYPHFDFRSIPDGLSEAVVSVADAVAVMTHVNDNCVEPFRESLSNLLSDVEEEPIACLITDAMLHFTQSVADSLKLPRIVLRTSNISSFLVFAGTRLLFEKGYFPIKGVVSNLCHFPDYYC